MINNHLYGVTDSFEVLDLFLKKSVLFWVSYISFTSIKISIINMNACLTGIFSFDIFSTLQLQ